MWLWSVADPEFPPGAILEGDAPTYLLFCKIFAENSMKMKEFGLREVGVASALLGSATDGYHLFGRKLD